MRNLSQVFPSFPSLLLPQRPLSLLTAFFPPPFFSPSPLSPFLSQLDDIFSTKDFDLMKRCIECVVCWGIIPYLPPCFRQRLGCREGELAKVRSKRKKKRKEKKRKEKKRKEKKRKEKKRKRKEKKKKRKEKNRKEQNRQKKNKQSKKFSNSPPLKKQNKN